MIFAVLGAAARHSIALLILAVVPPAAAGQFAYLVASDSGPSHSIAIVDIETRAIVSGPVGVRDYHMAAAVAPDGERLYALSRDANASSIGHLTVFATSGGAMLDTLTVGRNPQDVVASPDGARIYVANSADRTLSVIDARTLVQSTLALPICATRLAITPDSRHLFAACGFDVVRVDTQSLTVDAPKRLFTTDSIVEVAMHPDGGGLWLLAVTAAGTGKLVGMNTATLAIDRTLELDQWPRTVAVNPDGRSVYVGIATIAPTGALLSINAETAVVRASLPMPDGPRAMGVSQDGRHAYVATFLGPVAVVDLQLGSVSGRVHDAVFAEDLVVGPGALSGATRRTIVEFYHEKLDHYFITGYANEIDDLESGVHTGWKRTGEAFEAFEAGRSRGHGGPVCRFYGKPEAGLDSHFYSGHRSECDAVVRRFADSWQLEGLRVFDATLPNLVTGQCPYRTKPVYRLWNGRHDSNHRYTTSLAIRSAMRDQGFVAEGYGNDGVALCAVDDR